MSRLQDVADPAVVIRMILRGWRTKISNAINVQRKKIIKEQVIKLFIHIGNKKIISDTGVIGIFNIETLTMSEYNLQFLTEVDLGDKTVVVDESNKCIVSKVSSYTVIKRTAVSDFIWRRDYANEI